MPRPDGQLAAFYKTDDTPLRAFVLSSNMLRGLCLSCSSKHNLGDPIIDEDMLSGVLGGGVVTGTKITIAKMLRAMAIYELH